MVTQEIPAERIGGQPSAAPSEQGVFVLSGLAEPPIPRSSGAPNTEKHDGGGKPYASTAVDPGAVPDAVMDEREVRSTRRDVEMGEPAELFDSKKSRISFWC